MTNVLVAIAIIIASSFATYSTTADNCFEGLESIKTDPVRIDTLVLFDSKTYAESCYRTDIYLTGEATADSVLEIEEKVIELVKIDDCYQLLSVKQKIMDCN